VSSQGFARLDREEREPEYGAFVENERNRLDDLIVIDFCSQISDHSSLVRLMRRRVKGNHTRQTTKCNPKIDF
jgi:hypothetical protein